MSGADHTSAAGARPTLSPQDQSAQLRVPAGRYALSPLVGGGQDVAEFEMDTYPVTVERYRQFVDEGGYAQHDLWDEDGWLWCNQNGITAPRWWDVDEPDWGRFLTDDRPVVGVSWWEARAFCRFVERRLPTEIEWEAAARGVNGWPYPWGDEVESDRMGNRDIGPRLSWPVGYFDTPGPFGHKDLVGNVWQWTTDPWPPDQTDGTIAVRGGAWSARDEHCRTDHRNAYERDGRWSHVGFRTVAR